MMRVMVIVMMMMIMTIMQSTPRCFHSFSMSSTLPGVVFFSHIVNIHHNDDDDNEDHDGPEMFL